MIAIFNKLRQIEVFRNFSYLTIGGFISQAIGLITLIKITHYFSPENYGLFTFLLIQGEMIITIGDLGVRNVIIRSIARDRQRTNDLIRSGIILKLSAVFVISGIYIIYNNIWGQLSLTQVLLLSIFSILNCISHIFETMFLGNQKMLPMSVINLVTNAILCGLVFILPGENVSVLFLFSIYIIINLLKVLAFFTFLKFRKFFVGATQNIIRSSKNLIKESWPFLSLTLLMLPITYFSNNFLDINSTNEELGYFNLSQKLMMPINLIIGFALSSIFPNISSLWVKDKEKFYHYISIGIKYFVVIALALCFLFTLFAREIVIILFTDEYLPAIQVCQLQIWYIFLMGTNSAIGTIWASTNKEKLILRSGIVNATISIPMLYFGSKFGAMGLSYGYVISFTIFEFYLWYTFKKSENLKIKGDILIWSSAIIIFLISYLIPQDTALLYRLLIAAAIGTILAFYIYKTKALAELK